MSPEYQGNATLFLAKFFGRTCLLNLLTNASNQNAPGTYLTISKNCHVDKKINLRMYFFESLKFEFS